jgi:hypothetical protein
MPRRNRVTPTGELVAVPDRGMFWGNRGCLVDANGDLARYSRGRAWLICLLEFKGRRRTLWRPGRLTELFFLDEATGLAAGHRPCGECRGADYRAFKRAWSMAHGSVGLTVGVIDARLHAERLERPGTRRLFRAAARELPTGTVVTLDGACWLVQDGTLLRWTHSGYRDRRRVSGSIVLDVVTPRATVDVLAAGYRPVIHPSATNTQNGWPSGSV